MCHTSVNLLLSCMNHTGSSLSRITYQMWHDNTIQQRNQVTKTAVRLEVGRGLKFEKRGKGSIGVLHRVRVGELVNLFKLY